MKQSARNIFVSGSISPTMIGESIQHHQVKTAIGAHSIFLGQVRADALENSTVVAIEYTAYEAMALEVAHSIREEMFRKYELTCMHIYHSLGIVHVGEISLFVFTSSPHRTAAINACDETVERIKKELPVWGKELASNSQHVWKENK